MADVSLKMNTQLSIFIPIISVFLSGAISLIVAKIQIGAATKKLQIEHRQKATELLFQKRMEVYPSLYGILLKMTKKRWAEGLFKSDLIEFIQEFDAWEIANAVYVSPLGTDKIRRAKIVFAEIDSKVGDNKKLSNNETKKLVAEIHSLQMIVKTELGVLEAGDFHNPSKTKKFREIITFNDAKS